MKAIVTIYHGHGDAWSRLAEFKPEAEGWIRAGEVKLDMPEVEVPDEGHAHAIAAGLVMRVSWSEQPEVTLDHDQVGDLDVVWIRTRAHQTGDVFCVMFPSDDCEFTLGLGVDGWVTI